MIDVILPPLRFVKVLNRNPWNTRAIIADLETPMLFISGLRDELVPPPHVKRLYDDAVKCRIKHFYVVENGTHNDTWYRGGSMYRQAIRSFVDSVLTAPSPDLDIRANARRLAAENTATGADSDVESTSEYGMGADSSSDDPAEDL